MKSVLIPTKTRISITDRLDTKKIFDPYFLFRTCEPWLGLRVVEFMGNMSFFIALPCHQQLTDFQFKGKRVTQTVCDKKFLQFQVSRFHTLQRRFSKELKNDVPQSKVTFQNFGEIPSNFQKYPTSMKSIP